MNFRRTFGSHNVGATLIYQARRIDNNMLQGIRQYDDLYTKDILSQASLTNQSTTGSRGGGGIFVLHWQVQLRLQE